MSNFENLDSQRTPPEDGIYSARDLWIKLNDGNIAQVLSKNLSFDLEHENWKVKFEYTPPNEDIQEDIQFAQLSITDEQKNTEIEIPKDIIDKIMNHLNENKTQDPGQLAINLNTLLKKYFEDKSNLFFVTMFFLYVIVFEMQGMKDIQDENEKKRRAKSFEVAMTMLNSPDIRNEQ